MIKITATAWIVCMAFWLIAIGTLPKRWWKAGEVASIVTGTAFVLAQIWVLFP